MPETFGLSASSSVSRRFILASVQALERFRTRRLEPDDVVVLVLDGKTFAEDSMVLALGILRTGEKKLLGVVQTATENETTCAALLRGLVERGLRTDRGLLCVIDGAKGLCKAIQTVCGRQAVVQRCQWHKRQNVLASRPKGQQAAWRRRLQQAYEQPTCAEAQAALLALRRELRLVNRSAAASLEEGLEETLTLHRLGVFGALGRRLKTTNCLESLNAQLGQLTDKADRWRTSEQKHRWWPAPCWRSNLACGGSKGIGICPSSRPRSGGRSSAKTCPMPASPELRTLGLGMDRMTIVDPRAKTEAVFQADGPKHPRSAETTPNPRRRPLRNFN